MKNFEIPLPLYSDHPNWPCLINFPDLMALIEKANLGDEFEALVEEACKKVYG